MYQQTPPHGYGPGGPHRRGPGIYIIGAIAGVLAVGAVIAVVILLLNRNTTAAPAASSTTTSAAPSSPVPAASSPAGASASPTVTVTRAPPTAIVIQPPSSSGDTGTPDSYVTDIWNAGIVAPASWIQSTGQQLCSAWEAGDTTDATDQQLLAGGIYQDHLAPFDSITRSDLCPGA